MDENAFWQLIDEAHAASGGDPRRQRELLTAALAQFSEDEIFTFDKFLMNRMDQAYDAALWEAAFIVGCGCSDDGFTYFRSWLISRGQETFERVLADPEVLAEIVESGEETQWEEFLYVVDYAYEKKTGRDADEMPPRNRDTPILKGESSADEPAILRRFPKLAAKFWKRCLEMY